MVQTYQKEGVRAVNRAGLNRKALTGYLATGNIDPDIPPDASVSLGYEWIDNHLTVNSPEVQTETAVVNLAEGYAGKVDYYGPYNGGEKAIVGIKSCKVQSEPSFCMADAMQLSACAETIRLKYKLPDNPPVVSLIVSTSARKKNCNQRRD